MKMKVFIMGINFDKITKAKVGDIIYPAYNGTNGFFKKPEWHLVIEVTDDGIIKQVKYIQ